MNGQRYPALKIKLNPVEIIHLHEAKNGRDNAAANKYKVEMPGLK